MQTTKSGYRQHVTQHRPRGSQSASDHHCSLSASLPPSCGRRSHTWKGRGPSAGKSTLLGAVPIYPDPGQQGNNLSRSRWYWIRSGAGLFPCGFTRFVPTCLNFSLRKDLSVWRIWGGYFCRRRLGWEGLLTVGTPSPLPFDKTNGALDYNSPLGFAVILSSRLGKAGLWGDFRGSSFDGPSWSRGPLGKTTNQRGGAQNRYNFWWSSRGFRPLPRPYRVAGSPIVSVGSWIIGDVDLRVGLSWITARPLRWRRRPTSPCWKRSLAACRRVHPRWTQRSLRQGDPRGDQGFPSLRLGHWRTSWAKRYGGSCRGLMPFFLDVTTKGRDWWIKIEDRRRLWRWQIWTRRCRRSASRDWPTFLGSSRRAPRALLKIPPARFTRGHTEERQKREVTALL